MKHIILSLFLTLALITINAPYTSAQSPIDLMMAPDTGGYESNSISTLEKMLERAETLLMLNQTASAIDNGRGCSKHIDKAKSFRRKLLDLKQEYRGRADQTYWKKDQKIRADYTQAMDEYETCFNNEVGTFDELFQLNIFNLQAHKAETANNASGIKKGENIPRYIEQLKAAIEVRKSKLKQNIHAATIESVFKAVHYKRAERRHHGWLPAQAGTKLMLGDELRTGPRGRTRIQFKDYSAKSGGSPSILNLGPNTQIMMEKFHVSFGAGPSTSEVVIDLARGSLRAFKEAVSNFRVPSFKSKSTFSIRTAATLAGIRGTEIAVSYDPNTGIAEYHLDHGDAYAEINGVRTQLIPKTSVTVQGNKISKPRPLTPNIWGVIVNNTGAQHAETIETARAGGVITKEQRVRTISPTTNPPKNIPPSKDSDAIARELAQIVGGISSDYVVTIVESFNQATLNYEKNTAFRYLAKDLKEKFNKQLETATFRRLVDMDGVVVKAKADCSVCWTSDSTKFCTVKTQLYFEDGRQKNVFFFLREEHSGYGNRYKIYNINQVNTKTLKIFEQRKPYCKIYRTIHKTKY